MEPVYGLLTHAVERLAAICRLFATRRVALDAKSPPELVMRVGDEMDGRLCGNELAAHNAGALRGMGKRAD